MPKTLLLADDSVTIQKVVGISFASEDIQLVTVDNGTAAVAKAKELRPDIVLADVVMPGLNGYEVCRQIKGTPGLSHVPVLLLTGTFEAFDEVRAREAGSDGHITKPFEAQALVDLVNARLAAASPQPPAAARSAPKSAVGASPLFGEDEEPFDFMSDEVTEPSGTRRDPALARDALSFGSPDELDANAGDERGVAQLEVEAMTQIEVADADSGVAPIEEEDDENAETLPPVDDSDPIDDSPAATRVMFGEHDEPAASAPDAFASTRVLFAEPEPAGVGTITPAEAGAASDPFSDLIGGGHRGGHEIAPMDLGDPFAEEAEPDGAPAASATVVMGVPAAKWPAEEGDLFATPEPLADDEAGEALTTAPPAIPVATAAAQPGRDELRNMLEKMAWEAFGDVTDRVVRETVQRIEQIAWEVIPKMAETLIREEIRKLKEGDEQ
jgi:CheY-like chemotaxis protein